MSKTKKKPCKTCKKKETLTSLEVPTDEVIVTTEEIIKAWGYLTVTKRLQEPDKLKYTQGIYNLVTGQELNAGGCTSCKISKYKRIFKHHSEKFYNVNLK